MAMQRQRRQHRKRYYSVEKARRLPTLPGGEKSKGCSMLLPLLPYAILIGGNPTTLLCASTRCRPSSLPNYQLAAWINLSIVAFGISYVLKHERRGCPEAGEPQKATQVQKGYYRGGPSSHSFLKTPHAERPSTSMFCKIRQLRNRFRLTL